MAEILIFTSIVRGKISFSSIFLFPTFLGQVFTCLNIHFPYFSQRGYFIIRLSPNELNTFHFLYHSLLLCLIIFLFSAVIIKEVCSRRSDYETADAWKRRRRIEQSGGDEIVTVAGRQFVRYRHHASKRYVCFDRRGRVRAVVSPSFFAFVSSEAILYTNFSVPFYFQLIKN